MSNINKTYLSLISDSVAKKETLLSELILETMKQAGCFKDDDFDDAKYDEIYEKKMNMIHEIETLDEGFHSLYDRIKEELKENKYAYENEIKELQEKIKSVTDKGLRLQKLENDNRQKFEVMLSRQRSRVKEYKVSKKTAATYYKNMMKQFTNESVFYNKSK